MSRFWNSVRNVLRLRFVVPIVTVLLLALPGGGWAQTVTGTVTVGSYPYAMAVNPATGKVYVANTGGNTVSVIDGATNTVTSTVTVGTNPMRWP